MTTALRPRTLALFLGDLFFFAFSLWLSLYLRTFAPPSQDLFLAHLAPFSLLFALWVGVFFIAGLYESGSILLARRALSETLLISQVTNVVIAALFFFLIPIFGIAPKTLLLIYLVVSFLLVLLWRAYLFPTLGLQKPEQAMVVGDGPEIEELLRALRAAHRSPVAIVEVIPSSHPALARTITQAVETRNIRIIIADFDDQAVSTIFPSLYNLLGAGVRFIDCWRLYEEVFGRIPLSQVSSRWIARNVSRHAHALYDPVKRVTDIVIAFPAGIISLLLYPFIALAIKLDDGGPALISMPRVGEEGKPFSFYKFRSMSGNDRGAYGPGGTTTLNITRVGRFLRASRLDELPQLWNIVRGDLSLIGPRPESPSLVAVYQKEIPFYGLRHLIKPGLSGSAQLYYHGDPHHAADVEATKMKLSYDLFYLKHRSLTLDLSIILKTIRRLLIKSNA